MINLRDITEAYLSASKEDKVRFVNAVIPELIESPIFDSNEFKKAVDTAIILSDKEILPRLRSVEKVTGNYSFAEWEEHTPTLKEEITELKSDIETLKTNQITPDIIKAEMPVRKETTAEQKVCKLVEKLKIKARSPTGIKAIDNNEFKEFIDNELPEKLRGKDSNIRRFKARILQKAKEMYPDIIDIHKNKDGRHETTIFLKESKSYQSKGAVRIPLMLAGELL